MQGIAFSSEQFPAELDDRARFSLFRDVFTSYFGACEMAYSGEKPFSARWTLTQFGAVAVTEFAATLSAYARTREHVAGDTRGDFLIGFDRSRTSTTLSQPGRELALAPGQLALFSNGEPTESRAAGEMALVGLVLPRNRLLELVANADDLALLRLDGTRAAARHLVRYLNFLLEPQEPDSDSELASHIESTLLDLVALALGASGDAAEVARMRGMRAARLRQIISEIRAGFTKPAFSPGDVARKVGVSPRYIQDLLHESGSTFTERVMELRLQFARAMLANPRHHHRRISAIALEVGFGDLSYFNLAFRRRFGATPSEVRREALRERD
jgi:AraC-like DNA-binding protein